MSIFYQDKTAWDSKKFKATLATLIALALTPVLTAYLGGLAPTVADQISPTIAEFTIGLVGGLYIAAQAWVDRALAEKNGATPPSPTGAAE